MAMLNNQGVLFSWLCGTPGSDVQREPPPDIGTRPIRYPRSHADLPDIAISPGLWGNHQITFLQYIYICHIYKYYIYIYMCIIYICVYIIYIYICVLYIYIYVYIIYILYIYICILYIIYICILYIYVYIYIYIRIMIYPYNYAHSVIFYPHCGWFCTLLEQTHPASLAEQHRCHPQHLRRLPSWSVSYLRRRPESFDHRKGGGLGFCWKKNMIFQITNQKLSFKGRVPTPCLRISSESCSKRSTNIVLGSLGLFRSGRSHLPLMSSWFVMHNHSTLTDFQMIITFLFFNHPKPSDSPKDLEPPHKKRPNPQKNTSDHITIQCPWHRGCWWCTSLPCLAGAAPCPGCRQWQKWWRQRAGRTALRPDRPRQWLRGSARARPALGPRQNGVQKWQGLLGSWFISWVILYIGCKYIYIYMHIHII